MYCLTGQPGEMVFRGMCPGAPYSREWRIESGNTAFPVPSGSNE